jgi:hypothetical protein
MKYCPKCFGEFRDDVARCSECDAPLITREELEKLPEFRRTQGVQLGRFVKVTTAEDPFDMEAFCQALESEGIPVMARPQVTSSVDRLTSGSIHGWWEILVPQDSVDKATPILEKRRADLRSNEKEAGDAAEAEELEQEHGSPGRGNGSS